MPPLDLIIRTGGELRLSNFMLWQAAYAELWTTPVAWPEFAEMHLRQAVYAFSRRERRFGAVADLTVRRLWSKESVPGFRGLATVARGDSIEETTRP